jgi:hypothetical protein
MPGLGELPLILGALDDADNATNIEKLLRVWLSGAAGLEYAAHQLFLERSVDSAIGAQLDVVGKLAGQKRNGLVDDVYRRYIRARIRANRSTGSLNDLLRVLDLVVYDDDATLRAHSMGGASGEILVSGVATSNDVADAAIRFVRAAESAAVRIAVESGTADFSTWLVMDDAARTMDVHNMIDART